MAFPIVLAGGPPWGFKVEGGSDVHTPITISSVSDDSKAAQHGLQAGDVIDKINGESTSNLTNVQARRLIRQADSTLILFLLRKASPRLSIPEIRVSSPSTSEQTKDLEHSASHSSTLQSEGGRVPGVARKDAIPEVSDPEGTRSEEEEQCSGSTSDSQNSVVNVAVSGRAARVRPVNGHEKPEQYIQSASGKENSNRSVLPNHQDYIHSNEQSYTAQSAHPAVESMTSNTPKIYARTSATKPPAASNSESFAQNSQDYHRNSEINSNSQTDFSENARKIPANFTQSDADSFNVRSGNSTPTQSAQFAKFQVNFAGNSPEESAPKSDFSTRPISQVNKRFEDNGVGVSSTQSSRISNEQLGPKVMNGSYDRQVPEIDRKSVGDLSQVTSQNVTMQDEKHHGKAKLSNPPEKYQDEKLQSEDWWNSFLQDTTATPTTVDLEKIMTEAVRQDNIIAPLSPSSTASLPEDGRSEVLNEWRSGLYGGARPSGRSSVDLYEQLKNNYQQPDSSKRSTSRRQTSEPFPQDQFPSMQQQQQQQQQQHRQPLEQLSHLGQQQLQDHQRQQQLQNQQLYKQPQEQLPHVGQQQQLHYSQQQQLNQQQQQQQQQQRQSEFRQQPQSQYGISQQELQQQPQSQYGVSQQELQQQPQSKYGAPQQKLQQQDDRLQTQKQLQQKLREQLYQEQKQQQQQQQQLKEQQELYERQFQQDQYVMQQPYLGDKSNAIGSHDSQSSRNWDSRSATLPRTEYASTPGRHSIPITRLEFGSQATAPQISSNISGSNRAQGYSHGYELSESDSNQNTSRSADLPERDWNRQDSMRQGTSTRGSNRFIPASQAQIRLKQVRQEPIQLETVIPDATGFYRENFDKSSGRKDERIQSRPDDSRTHRSVKRISNIQGLPPTHKHSPGRSDRSGYSSSYEAYDRSEKRFDEKSNSWDTESESTMSQISYGDRSERNYPQAGYGSQRFGEQARRTENYQPSQYYSHSRPSSNKERIPSRSNEEAGRRPTHDQRLYHARSYSDSMAPMHNRVSNLTSSRFGNEYNEDLHPSDVSPSTRIRGKAKALYTFKGQNSRELSFRKGDILHILRRVDKNWYKGEHYGVQGIFPVNYVKVLVSLEEARQTALQKEGVAVVKYTFVAQASSELTLRKGEVVQLIGRMDENWWEGRIGTRRGIFPASYVECSHNSRTPMMTPLSSLAPTPVPGTPSRLSPSSSAGSLMGPELPSMPISPWETDFESEFELEIRPRTPVIMSRRAMSDSGGPTRSILRPPSQQGGWGTSPLVGPQVGYQPRFSSTSAPVAYPDPHDQAGAEYQRGRKMEVTVPMATGNARVERQPNYSSLERGGYHRNHGSEAFDSSVGNQKSRRMEVTVPMATGNVRVERQPNYGSLERGGYQRNQGSDAPRSQSVMEGRYPGDGRRHHYGRDQPMEMDDLEEFVKSLNIDPSINQSIDPLEVNNRPINRSIDPMKVNSRPINQSIDPMVINNQSSSISPERRRSGGILVSTPRHPTRSGTLPDGRDGGWAPERRTDGLARGSASIGSPPGYSGGSRPPSALRSEEHIRIGSGKRVQIAPSPIHEGLVGGRFTPTPREVNSFIRGGGGGQFMFSNPLRSGNHERYLVLYDYRPMNPDELELRAGESVAVTERCDDGWYVGFEERTSRFGTFPGNYVRQL